MVAGVARGLAEHLDVPVGGVRVAFAVLTAASGMGVVLYAAFWAVVPQERATGATPDRSRRAQLLLYAAVALGLLLGLSQLGVIGSAVSVLPLIVCAVGAAIIWGQADESRRSRPGVDDEPVPWLPGGGVGLHLRRTALTKLAAGLVLVVGGLIGFLAVNRELAATRDGLIATGAILGGVALVSAPWWWRLVNELSEERRARIRTQERADLAAHVHDSVLHTLALIQRNATDPREVARLARGQERELRSWLYQPTASPDETFAAALEQAAAEVEDAFAVQVEAVVVGDCPVDDSVQALVQAAREAMVNAGKHAKVGTVSLYAEVEEREITAFIRDRGRGFDVDSVPADRHGIAGSIIDRMARHGGQARLKSTPGEGTEVRLTMGRNTA